MKRHGNLWEQVIGFEALLRAADMARKGKANVSPKTVALFMGFPPRAWR